MEVDDAVLDSNAGYAVRARLYEGKGAWRGGQVSWLKRAPVLFNIPPPMCGSSGIRCGCFERSVRARLCVCMCVLRLCMCVCVLRYRLFVPAGCQILYFLGRYPLTFSCVCVMCVMNTRPFFIRKELELMSACPVFSSVRKFLRAVPNV